MKNLIKKFFHWLFSEELTKLNQKIKQADDLIHSTANLQRTIKQVFNNLDISIDVREQKYEPAKSWAVISLQGERADFVKFINLGDREINEISRFLRQFDRINRIKIDAPPSIDGFLRFESRRNSKPMR